MGWKAGVFSQIERTEKRCIKGAGAVKGEKVLFPLTKIIGGGTIFASICPYTSFS